MKERRREMNENTKTEEVWLIANKDRSYVNGRIFDSKSAAENEIKWDNTLSGCIAIPAKLTY